MARQLNFKYRIRLCSDNEYGNEQADGTWVNIKDVRLLPIFLERDDRRGDSSKGLSWISFVRVISREPPTGQADLAIGSLTISYEREQRVSFTTPFMNTGVSILYKTAKPSDPGAWGSLLNWQMKNANPLNSFQGHSPFWRRSPPQSGSQSLSRCSSSPWRFLL
jgi:hypothetical protein